MKKQLTLFAAICIMFFSAIGFAQNNKVATELKNQLQKERLSNKDISAAYNKLNYLIEQKATAPSVKELLELCLLYARHDMSDAPYGFAGSIKAINPKEFNEVLKTFSLEDQKKIKTFIEFNNSAGNG